MMKLPSGPFGASFRCGLWADAHAARELLACDLLLAIEVELLEVCLRECEEELMRARLSESSAHQKRAETGSAVAHPSELDAKPAPNERLFELGPRERARPVRVRLVEQRQELLV